MICPHCNQEIEQPAPALLKIRGEPVKIVGGSTIKCLRVSKKGKQYKISPSRHIPVMIVECRDENAPLGSDKGVSLERQT